MPDSKEWEKPQSPVIIDAVQGTITEVTPVAIVVSPWLPTVSRPFAGSFVADFIACGRTVYGSVAAIHVDDTIRSATPRFHQLFANDLTKRRVAAARPGHNGLKIHVPLLVRQGWGWRERVEQAHRAGQSIGHLVEHLASHGFGVLPAHVHAHVGLISATAALPWLSDNELHIYEHGSFLFQTLDDPYISSAYARSVDAARTISAVNPAMAARLADRFPAAAEKIESFPNPLDFTRFAFREREAPLRRWIYIGNVKLDKGLERLIDAFRIARTKFDDISLTLVGDGPDLSLVRDADISEHVTFQRPVPPAMIPELLSTADLLVHLSHHETFGMTAIEAIASGLPVLATETDGSAFTLSETIEMAGTMLPQSASPERIADAYSELRDAPRRLDLQSARNSLEARFSAQAISDQLSRRVRLATPEHA